MKPQIVFALLGCAACFATAQRSSVDILHDSLSLSTQTVGSDTVVRPEVRDKILNFYYDQFRHSQDPGAPYFLFMSKNSDLIMGIGGVVRLRGTYDWDGAMGGKDFEPYSISMTPVPTRPHKLGTTASGTSLYFRLLGHNAVMGDFQAYIEANFNGYGSRDFRLKKSYISFRDFTVGLANSTFSDPSAMAPMVDGGGANNKVDHTNVLVRYMPRIADNWLAAVSVETPSTDIAADGKSTAVCSSYIPDFAAFMQYDWGHKHSQHVRLAAIYRSLPYRNLLTERNHNLAGWGVQLSSVSHPVAPLTVYAAANYGAGYAGMSNDMGSHSYDLVADPELPGQLYAPRLYGWSLGVQYNFTPSLFVSVSGSQLRYLPGKAVAPGEYKYGIMGCANVFWNPVPRVQLGAEIDLGRRTNFSSAHASARRTALIAQLSF